MISVERLLFVLVMTVLLMGKKTVIGQANLTSGRHTAVAEK